MSGLLICVHLGSSLVRLRRAEMVQDDYSDSAAASVHRRGLRFVAGPVPKRGRRHNLGSIPVRRCVLAYGLSAAAETDVGVCLWA